MTIIRTQDDICFTVYDFSLKATLRIDEVFQFFNISDSPMALMRCPLIGMFSVEHISRSRYMIQNSMIGMIYSLKLLLNNCNSSGSGYLRFVRIFGLELKEHIVYMNIADVLLLNSHTTNLVQPFQFDGYELSIEIEKTSLACVVAMLSERISDPHAMHTKYKSEEDPHYWPMVFSQYVRIQLTGIVS